MMMMMISGNDNRAFSPDSSPYNPPHQYTASNAISPHQIYIQYNIRPIFARFIYNTICVQYSPYLYTIYIQYIVQSPLSEQTTEYRASNISLLQTVFQNALYLLGGTLGGVVGWYTTRGAIYPHIVIRHLHSLHPLPPTNIERYAPHPALHTQSTPL